MARRVSYDPMSGRDFLVQVSFSPDDARKLIGMSEASRSSVREVLRILVQQAEIDRSGRSVLVEKELTRRSDEAAKEAGLF